MGKQIMLQPDGHLAVFDTVSDMFVLYDATEDDVVAEFEVTGTKADHLREKIDHVAAGHPERVYYQFTLTWDEALSKDRDSGGSTWQVMRDRGWWTPADAGPQASPGAGLAHGPA